MKTLFHGVLASPVTIENSAVSLIAVSLQWSIFSFWLGRTKEEYKNSAVTATELEEGQITGNWKEQGLCRALTFCDLLTRGPASPGDGREAEPRLGTLRLSPPLSLSLLPVLRMDHTQSEARGHGVIDMTTVQAR